jgi:hypothetical protein
MHNSGLALMFLSGLTGQQFWGRSFFIEILLCSERLPPYGVVSTGGCMEKILKRVRPCRLQIILRGPFWTIPGVGFFLNKIQTL